MGSLLKTSSLNEVKPYKSMWCVRVKVLHTWISFSHQFGASLQMVLADENGIKIQATCNQSLLEKFEKQCVVGEWKVISNFTLSPAVGLDRHTNHVFKMQFVSQTSITDCELACQNMFLNLHAFDTISNGSIDPRFRIDVIGEIIGFGGQKLQNLERKEVAKLEFILRDINDGRLPCLITGKLAVVLTQDNNQLKLGDICLFRFARIGKYKEELHLSNAYDSSLLIVNPAIAEAEALKQKFGGEEKSFVVYQNVRDKIHVQEKHHRWSQYPFKTIQEMRRCDKGENCRVICSIYAIDTMTGWYFIACGVCQSEVYKKTELFGEMEHPSWWCVCCNQSVTKVSARYKLDLLVQDQTGESRFTLLDSVATSIVNTPAAKIVNPLLDEVENLEMLPPQLVQIVGKTYGFGILFDENNKTSQDGNFKSSKVWTLSEVIWKKAKALHQNSATSRKKQCTNVTESGSGKSG